MTWKSYILFCLVVLVSCTTTKNTTTTEILTKSTPANSSNFIAKVQLTQPNFTTANMSKVSIAMKFEEKELTVSASCKIRRDSVIYLSIQPFLGIELFKAELMQDSVKIFDKMNAKLYVGSYDLVFEKFGIKLDFNSLQALLTNQLFSINQSGLSSAAYTSSIGQQQIEFQNNSLKQVTSISDHYNILKVLMKDEKNHYQLSINYDEFTSMNGINFPREINFMAKNENKTATCNVSIEKVEFNSPIHFIPTNEQRFTRAELFKLLQQH
jgi:Domain of unknown function (DUF4292)